MSPMWTNVKRSLVTLLLALASNGAIEIADSSQQLLLVASQGGMIVTRCYPLHIGMCDGIHEGGIRKTFVRAGADTRLEVPQGLGAVGGGAPQRRQSPSRLLQHPELTRISTQAV